MESVRADVEEKFQEVFPQFEALEVQSQVVAGTNLVFRVQVDEGKYIGVKIFIPLPHTGETPRLVQAEKE